ncbi:luciferase family protein [Rubrobacter indicoceani]|uniref:luciferase domain-containing protein n=1 Tax=Rubrobacter indicoceani TaxID=2051957 RepID=UPI001F0963CA|nr:luciferase family protein [Rubrobacter indicoceani]
MKKRRMDERLIASLERELLSWPGVFKRYDADGIGGLAVTGYRYGDPETGGPQLGHLHHDGVADLQFPRELREDLVRAGKAQPHRGGFRAVVSYRIGSEKDIPGAVSLFRLSYGIIAGREDRKASRRVGA